MYIYNELKVLDKFDFNPEIRQDFSHVLSYIIQEIIKSKNMFTMDNFNLYYYDEFTFETYCHKDIYNTIFVEIDQPLNYRPTKNITNKNTKIKFPELYYQLDEFEEDLFHTLVSKLDNNNIIWREDHSICLKTIVNDENDSHSYFFKIIPCIAHYNKNSVKGQFYKKNNGLEINYIDKSLENFHKKNYATNGVYKDTILIFKNILLLDKKISSLPNEIIETILYNVPDNMFIDLTKKSMINIINYIRNNSIKNFKTLDEQDLAFVSIYRSMSLIYVKHIMKIIEKYFSNN